MCLIFKRNQIAANFAGNVLHTPLVVFNKAVHVHEHVDVYVNVKDGVNTPWSLTKPVVVDVLVLVDVDRF